MAFRLIGSGKQSGSANNVPLPKRFHTRQIGYVMLAALSLVVVAGANAEPLRAKFTAKTFATAAGFTMQANLPSGVVGVAYKGSVSARGGVTPYSFSIPDGSLPKGLSLNSTTGAVTGAPSVAGLFRFKIVARDAAGSVTWLHAQITIASSSTSGGVAITVSPTTASLLSGSIQHFTAMVSGTSATSVVWSANAGTITDGGYFTAPTVSSTTSVTVTATSAADTTKKASATVTVSPAASTPVSIAVSPGSVALTSGAAQQFNAAVQGSSNTAVLWSATSGSVSSSGMFTAPAVASNTNVTVTATSAADTTKKASAAVTVSGGGSGGTAGAGGSSGGPNWQLVPTPAGATHINFFAVDGANNWYLADQSSGFWKSSNQGSTWTQINSGIANTSGENIQVNPTNGDLIAGIFNANYPSAGPANFYRSTNGGSSWSLITPPGGFFNSWSPAMSGCLMPNPTTARMLCGGFFGSANTTAWYSTNNGTTTALINQGTNSTVYSFGWNDVTGNFLMGTETQGLFQSTDGVNFSSISPGSGTIRDGNIFGIVNDSSGIPLFDSQGGIWKCNSPTTCDAPSNVLSNGNTSAGAGLFKDSQGSIYYGHNHDTANPITIYHSIDQGATWQQWDTGIPTGGLQAAHFIENPVDGNIYVVMRNTASGNVGGIYRTPKGGGVAVSPGSATLTSGGTQQFNATVQGSSNTSVTWSATSGSVSSGGMFTAPTVTSNTSVTVTATSIADTTKKSSASVTVAPVTTTAALAITTSGLPGAQSGAAYSSPISATGGTQPYQWTVSSGSLPSGFALSSTGQLAGSTTQAGTFTFTAQVTDAGSSTTSKIFSLAVSAPPSPTSTGGTTGYDGPAELPRVYMQTALANTPAPGSIIQVPAGGNLQTAFNSAACGDTIELAAGATFSGVFTLPANSCDNLHWIIVRTSAPNASLPPEGTRITPCYSGVASLPGRPAFNCPSTQVVTAKIVGGISGPIFLAAGANHYRFLGLELTRTAASGSNYGLIRLNGQADHIVVDRSWLHGTAQDETVVAWSLDGVSYGAVVDSYANDFHCETVTGSCTDSTVLSGGTSSTADGPYKITNNFLESSGENILFGGGSATYAPADIEIRHNHFFKPLTWMQGQPGFVGGTSGNPFLVKNLLELKNAQRVLIEGNIFENSWGGFSQMGYAILLTPKNQAGANGTNICPLCQVTDVTIRYNTISHTGAGISIADVLSDNGGAAAAGERYSIHDITLDDINATFYKGSGTLFQVYNEWPANSLNNVSINHITGFPDAGSRIIGLGNYSVDPVMTAFSLKNSIIGQALYPIWSTGGTTNCAFPNVPVTSLNACFPNGYSFVDNAIIATSTVNYPPSTWPSGNFFPSTASGVQFVNFNNGNGGDYHLVSTSPYKNAGTDGKDLGADINAIQSATAGVY